MPLGFYTNTATSYGSQIPFQRIVEPQKLGLFLNLEQAELLRLQRYNEAWRFFFGQHWSFNREDGEPLVTVNYYRKFIDKHVEFLMGKGFSIKVPEALEEITRPFLDEVWEYNGRDLLANAIALTGGVTGDVFVMVTEEEPTEMQRQVNPFTQGRIRINLLGSEQVYPSWDPLDHTKVTAVRVETIYHSSRATDVVERDSRQDAVGKQLNVKRFTQIITPGQIVEQFQGEMPSIRPNPLGEVNLVHIANLPVPREYYGMSDGTDLLDLQRELNEKSTDISDVINYHAAPITVITGARAKNLERGPRQIWSGLPEGAKVANLQLEGDLNAAHTWWDKVKKAMFEIGDIPEGILGEMQPISNTSGVALHQQFGPIMGRRMRKLPSYREGLQQINYFILRIAQMKGYIALPFDPCDSCGGRIIEVPTGETVPVWNPTTETYDDVPQMMKKCFRINKMTLDFEKPEDVKIKIWRQYGFGGELRQVTLSEAEEIAAGKKSFWDYAVVNLEEEEAYKKEVGEVRKRNLQKQKEAADAPPPPPQTDELGNEVPPENPGPQLEAEPAPPIPQMKPLPIGEVEVPEEPIRILISTPLVHPRTGEVVRVIEQDRLLVPCGCERPRYLNPFKTIVEFTDPLPKDEALDADLYIKYQANTWVDPEWVQDQIPRISKDKQAINRRKKAMQTSGLPQPMSMSMMPGAQAAPPVTDLTPAVQPANSVPGPGGNPVPPGESAA